MTTAKSAARLTITKRTAINTNPPTKRTAPTSAVPTVIIVTANLVPVVDGSGTGCNGNRCPVGFVVVSTMANACPTKVAATGR
jgi:hypothetical protein